MKSFLIAAALIVGTPALAQDMPAAPAPSTTPDSSATPPAPAPATNAAPAFTPTPVDSASLPKCSRTVTDKCIQSAAVHKKHKK
jgi:hypothetical protein